MISAANLRIAFVIAAVASCAGGPKVAEEDPFKSSPDEYQNATRIVALADVEIPDGLPDPDPIRANFQGLIEARLRSAGYSIVFPQQYQSIWKRFEEGSGGFVDSTGARDPSAIARAMAGTLDQLDAGFALDAIVVPTVAVVEAPFGGGRAVWDGTWQPIKTGGVMKGFFAGSPDGTLGALSLKITVLSAGGTVLYEKAGGIEVLSKLEGKDFVLVPRQELFTDQDRIEKAVAIALDELLE